MAEILKFGLEIDVISARDKALHDIKSLVPELEKALNLSLDFNVSTESIKELSNELNRLENKHIDIIDTSQREAIGSLVSELQSLIPLLEKIEQAAGKQTEQIAKSLSASMKAAIEEERLAQAKEKTAQAQSKSVNEAAKAEAAIARQLIIQEKLTQLQNKSSLPTDEIKRFVDGLDSASEAFNTFEEVFSGLGQFDIASYFKNIAEDFQSTDISRYFEDASGNARSYEESLKLANDEIERAASVQAKLADAFADGSITADEYSKYYGQIADGANIASEAIQMLSPNAKDASKEIEAIVTSLNVAVPKEWGNAVVSASKDVAIARDELRKFKNLLENLYSKNVTSDIDNFAEAEANLNASIIEANRVLKDRVKNLETAITKSAELTDELQNEEGSYNQIKNRIEELIKVRDRYNQGSIQYGEAQREIERLAPQLETLDRLQGKTALSSRTWGRDVVDLTYAIRVLNPTLGIYAQRIQRVSVLGRLWNQIVQKTSVLVDGNVKAAQRLLTSVAGLSLAIGLLVYKRYKNWREEQEKIRESLNKTRRDAQSFSDSLRKSFKDIEAVVNIGLSDNASFSQIKEAENALYKIVSSNEALLPLVERRLAAISDEKDRLKEIKNLYDEIVDIQLKQSNLPNPILSLFNGVNIFEESASKLNKAINNFFIKLQNNLAKGLIPRSFYDEIVELRVSGASLSEIFIATQSGLNSLQYDGEITARTFRSFSDVLSDLEHESNNFNIIVNNTRFAIRNLYKEFENQTVDWDADNFGLSEKSANRLKSEVASYINLIFDGASDELKIVEPLFRKALADTFSIAEIEISFDQPILELNKWQAALTENGLYTNEQARGFIDIHDAGRDLAKKYKELEDRLKRLKQQYEGANESGRKFIETLIEQDKATMGFIKTAQEVIGPSTDKIKKVADTRQQELIAELNVIKEAENAYTSLRDAFTDAESASKTKSLYDGLVAQFKKLSGAKIDLKFDGSDYERAVEYAIKNAKALGLKQKNIIQLQAELSKRDVDRIKREIKDLIDGINRDIKNQQAANKLFEDLFSSSGDLNLAKNVTFAITGKQIDNIRQQTVVAIERLLSEYDLEIPINIHGDIDFSELEEIIKTLPKDIRTSVESMSESIKKIDSDVVAGFTENLQQFQTYEDKRTVIANKAAAERSKLDEQLALGHLGKGLQDSLEQYYKYLDAIDKAEKKALSKIDIEEIKVSEDFINAFQDLSNIGNVALQSLISTLEEYRDKSIETLSPTELSELNRLLQQLYDEAIARNPFDVLISSLEEYRAARLRLKEAESSGDTEAIAKAQSEVAKALSDSKKAADGLRSAIDTISSAVNDAIKLVRDLAEGFGAEFNEDTERILNNIGLAFGVISGAVGILTAALTVAALAAVGLGTALAGIGIAAGALTAIFTLFTIDWGGKVKEANKEIQRQQVIIDNLTKSYNDLEYERGKALGAESVVLGRKQIEAESKKINAIQAQIDAERSKGKKADKDKIAAWEQELDNTADNIRDITDSLVSDILGSGISEVASQWASSWVDAYFSLENTFDAINSSFKALARNIAKNAIATKIVNKFLDPILKQIDKAVDASGQVDLDVLNQAFVDLEEAVIKIDGTLTDVFSNPVFQRLFDQAETSLQGISAAIASITEDTALLLAGELGSINYYGVARLNELIMIKESLNEYFANYGSSVLQYQQSALSYYELINNNISLIVQSNQALLNALNSVIYPSTKGPALRF